MPVADIDDLKAQKDALDRARFGGVRTVQHGDKQVTYKTQAEMDKASAALGDAINAAQGKRRNRQVRIYTNRGL